MAFDLDSLKSCAVNRRVALKGDAAVFVSDLAAESDG